MIETDEKMTSLTQAFKGLPLIEPRREDLSSSHFGIAHRSPSCTQGNVYACVKEMRGYFYSYSVKRGG